MLKLLSRSLVVGVASVALPLTAMAATPQQLIDTLSMQSTTKAMSMDGTVEITVNERALVKGTETSSGSAKLRITQRVLPQATGARPETEGLFAIESGSVKTSTEPMASSLDGRIAIQWKYTGGTVYFRVEGLPPTIRHWLTQEDMNVEQFIGTWFRLDQEMLKELGSLSPELTAANDTNSAMAQLKALGVKQPFLAQRVEQRKKDVNGDSIVRVRARLNPRIMTALLQMELKKIGAKDPNRAQLIKNAYADYSKIVAITSKLSFVFVINETKKELNRLEMGGTFIQPRKSCTYEAKNNYREVCRTVANTTVKLVAGFSMNKDSGAAIEVPASSMTLEELGQKMEEQYRAQHPEYYDDSTTTVPEATSSSWYNDANMTQTLMAP